MTLPGIILSRKVPMKFFFTVISIGEYLNATIVAL